MKTQHENQTNAQDPFSSRIAGGGGGEYEYTEQPEAESKPLSLLAKWAVLLIIIGILPWSYYCFTTLFPRLAVTFGISSIRFGFLIALILVPPVLLFQVIRFLEWVFSDMDTSEY